MEQPAVSVVIATCNRSNLLAETLEALRQQSLPAGEFEVVVADNGSTDRTRQVVENAAREADASIRYVFEPRPGKSHAVNAAIEAARGALIAFTDDDVTPSHGWLESMARAIEETGAGFGAGRIVPRWETRPPSWLQPALYGILAVPDNGTKRLLIRRGENEHVMPIGANMAVRREVLDRVGGLRADVGKLGGTLRSGEDHEFYLRLLGHGCTGVYEPRALVRHFVPAARLTHAYFRRWSYVNGRIVAGLERDYPTTDRYLLGVPRYLWRAAAEDAWRAAWALLRRDTAARFTAAVRLLWFAGYLREVWQGCEVRHSVPARA